MSQFKNLSLLALALAATGAFADPVAPKFTDFGNLSEAGFSGKGIPTDPAAITKIAAEGNNPAVTLGMIATPRYEVGGLGIVAPGVYHANSGAYSTPYPTHGSPATNDTNYALWNFDFYISANTSNYSYKLFYDMDPAAGTDQDAMGFINLPAGYQDSWNLGMDFLASWPTAPDFSNFDPTVAGEYGFALVAYEGDREVGRSAIVVEVPEPASMALVGIGLLGAAVASRRRRVK